MVRSCRVESGVQCTVVVLSSAESLDSQLPWGEILSCSTWSVFQLDLALKVLLPADLTVGVPQP